MLFRSGFQYDKHLNNDLLKKYLQIIKDAVNNIDKKIDKDVNNGEMNKNANIILVRIDEVSSTQNNNSSASRNDSNNEMNDNILITINANNEINLLLNKNNKKIELKNITLDILKETLKKSINEQENTSVSIKADKLSNSNTIADIKNILRGLNIMKLNMSN